MLLFGSCATVRLSAKNPFHTPVREKVAANQERSEAKKYLADGSLVFWGNTLLLPKYGPVASHRQKILADWTALFLRYYVVQVCRHEKRHYQLNASDILIQLEFLQKLATTAIFCQSNFLYKEICCLLLSSKFDYQYCARMLLNFPSCRTSSLGLVRSTAEKGTRKFARILHSADRQTYWVVRYNEQCCTETTLTKHRSCGSFLQKIKLDENVDAVRWYWHFPHRLGRTTW